MWLVGSLMLIILTISVTRWGWGEVCGAAFWTVVLRGFREMVEPVQHVWRNICFQGMCRSYFTSTLLDRSIKLIIISQHYLHRDRRAQLGRWKQQGGSSVFMEMFLLSVRSQMAFNECIRKHQGMRSLSNSNGKRKKNPKSQNRTGLVDWWMGLPFSKLQSLESICLRWMC